jgi:hypothetical protein
MDEEISFKIESGGVLSAPKSMLEAIPQADLTQFNARKSGWIHINSITILEMVYLFHVGRLISCARNGSMIYLQMRD